MKLIKSIFIRSKQLVIYSEQGRMNCIRSLHSFCKKYEPSTRIDEFESRTVTESHFNLPIQLGTFNFSTKYRIVGQISGTEKETHIDLRIKDDIYWTTINIATPLIILIFLLNDQSITSIAFSVIMLLGLLIRWLLTSIDLERIETEIKQSFKT